MEAVLAPSDEAMNGCDPPQISPLESYAFSGARMHLRVRNDSPASCHLIP